MRRTTIKDVAALAGVSPATVSRALDDRPEISAETKERVRAACAQLGYVPNAAARGLTGQATHTLGVVVPDVSNPYFTGIATAIEETAAENGYRVLLSNSLQEEGRELRAIENFLARQIDGVRTSMKFYVSGECRGIIRGKKEKPRHVPYCCASEKATFPKQQPGRASKAQSLFLGKEKPVVKSLITVVMALDSCSHGGCSAPGDPCDPRFRSMNPFGSALDLDSW